MVAEGADAVTRELRFTGEDIALFVAASRDRNPLHTDAEFANASAFGMPIVHGALIATAMLGALPESQLARVRSLRISFAGPLPVGTSATLSASAREGEPGAWQARLTVRGRTVARVLACTHSDQHTIDASLHLPADAPLRPMRGAPAEPDALELQAGHTLRGSYQCGLELDEIAARFGAGALDRRLLEALAWTSYVVGMELPGLRSLLAALTVNVEGGAPAPARGQAPEYALTVRNHDERTGQLTLDGALDAPQGSARALSTIHCFALPPPAHPDPGVLGLKRPREHDRLPEHDRGAVVVAGGSRGFGASLALALLGLGYEVHVAYANSRARAAELQRLAGAHKSRLHLARVDVRDPESLRSLADAVARGGRPLMGLALTAAQPPLAMSLTACSALQLADYVAASLRLAAAPLGSLLPSIDEQDGWVLVSSSVALAAPPRDWPHYVSAKAAVEGLASWVATTRPSLRTVILRAPKMRTDMTATPSGHIGAASADAVAVWTAERLAGGVLAPGLTTLEPQPLALERRAARLEQPRALEPQQVVTLA